MRDTINISKTNMSALVWSKSIDLIGPLTLKDIDGTEIDFICLALMTQLQVSFKIVEIPVNTDVVNSMNTMGQKDTKHHINTKLSCLGKSSAMISNLLNM